jgi:hypothetical protein
MGLRTTQGDEKQLLSSNDSLWKRPPSPLSSRPKRTRKSGGAQWRDLCVGAPSWECFSCRVITEAKPGSGNLFSTVNGYPVAVFPPNLHIGTISLRRWLTHDQEVRIPLPAVKDLMRLPR